MDGMIPMRHRTWCGKYMKFEGDAELAGTAIVRLVNPMPNQLVNLFSCECGHIESVEQERCSTPFSNEKPLARLGSVESQSKTSLASNRQDDGRV